MPKPQQWHWANSAIPLEQSSTNIHLFVLIHRLNFDKSMQHHSSLHVFSTIKLGDFYMTPVPVIKHARHQHIWVYRWDISKIPSRSRSRSVSAWVANTDEFSLANHICSCIYIHFSITNTDTNMVNVVSDPYI